MPSRAKIKITLSDAKESVEEDSDIQTQEEATCKGCSKDGREQDDLQDEKYQQAIGQEKEAWKKKNGR